MYYVGLKGDETGFITNVVRGSRTWDQRITARVAVRSRPSDFRPPFNAFIVFGVEDLQNMWAAGIDGYGEFFGESANYPVVTYGISRIAGGVATANVVDGLYESPTNGYMPSPFPAYPPPNPFDFNLFFDLVVEVRKTGLDLEITLKVTPSQVVATTFTIIGGATTSTLADGRVGVAANNGDVMLDWFRIEPL